MTSLPQLAGAPPRRGSRRVRRHTSVDGLASGTPQVAPEVGLVAAGRVRPVVAEALLLGTLWLMYQAGRLLADGNPASALDHAADVWALERWLYLPDEQVLQSAVLSDWSVTIANHYYLSVHFPAMIAFLAWAFLRRRDDYRRIRTVLVLLTAAGLVIHLAYPLAPPRMLTDYGLIDTGSVYGPSAYSGSEIANEYAALPSLHVGWAMLEAWAVTVYTRSRWRYLVWVHPLVTTLVVVVTANHYWIDGLLATLLLTMAIALTSATGALRVPPPLTRLRRTGTARLPAPRPAREPQHQDLSASALAHSADH